MSVLAHRSSTNGSVSESTTCDDVSQDELIILLVEKPSRERCFPYKDPRVDYPELLRNAPFLTVDASPTPDIDSVLWSELVSSMCKQNNLNQKLRYVAILVVLMIYLAALIVIVKHNPKMTTIVELKKTLVEIGALGFLFTVLWRVREHHASKRQHILEGFKSRFAAVGYDVHLETVRLEFCCTRTSYLKLKKQCIAVNNGQGRV